MRLVFLGTPDDAVPPLRALVDAGHDVALVITQPDKRRGRGSATAGSPVKQAAEALDIPVLTPNRASEVIDDVRAADADLGVVVAFGQLLKPAFLESIDDGFVNVHFSLLPRWRGAAPVERAILAGDTETGVCLMRVDVGLDTGGVYTCARTPIGDDETAGELGARLVALGTKLLVAELPNVLTTTPTEQSGESTYAAQLSVDEFRIDPARAAAELARLVRAGNPRPGAWLRVGGRRLKVLRAHAVDDAAAPGVVTEAGLLGTASGALALDEVQPEGKKPMDAAAWTRGLQGDLTVDVEQ